MVLEEAMRLYPPGWAIPREALQDDEIDGYHIAAGSLILVCPFLTHRHPAFWSDPERFDPERFRPEQAATRPPYAYYPFGGGPRICIGNHFALLEAQLVLATVAQRYRLRLLPGQVVVPSGRGTLRPARDLLVTLQAR
jgi:cytochrome P450